MPTLAICYTINSRNCDTEYLLRSSYAVEKKHVLFFEKLLNNKRKTSLLKIQIYIFKTHRSFTMKTTHPLRSFVLGLVALTIGLVQCMVNINSKSNTF